MNAEVHIANKPWRDEKLDEAGKSTSLNKVE
jgi:hypothetical protein